jgi:hypothetical protein
MAALVRWVRDHRGSVVVQSLYLIAILLVTIYMSVEIWKVISVSQSVHAATYQAAKYIALNGREWGLSPSGWAEKVLPYVVTELSNNPFVDVSAMRAGPYQANPNVTVWLNPECNYLNYCRRGNFWVKIEWTHSVSVPPRFGRNEATLLRVTVIQKVDGKLECYP